MRSRRGGNAPRQRRGGCFVGRDHFVPQRIQYDAKAFLHHRLKGITLALKRITSCANATSCVLGKMPARSTEGATRYATLLGNHQNGSASTASAVVSIASWTGLPTTGTMDATAPPTRIGTVATFVKKHPDNPNNNTRSVSHLIPDI